MGLPKWTLKKLFVLVEACVYLEKFSSCRLMKFWIGTSGFQYAEWKGNFYPEDLPAAKMLPFYAERLSTTEINYTFHRIPAPKTIDNWKALKVVTTDYGYLRLRREDYAESDVERWTKFVREQESNWGEAFVYFKHEEAGIGPKLASQMKELLNCESTKNPMRNA